MKWFEHKSHIGKRVADINRKIKLTKIKKKTETLRKPGNSMYNLSNRLSCNIDQNVPYMSRPILDSAVERIYLYIVVEGKNGTY